MDTFAYIILSFVILIMIWMILQRKSKDKIQYESWKQFAKQRGYNYNLGVISGNYKGIPFSISRYAHESITGLSVLGTLLDKDKGKIYTIFKFKIATLPEGLQIYLREMLTNSETILTAKANNHPIETNDKEFDKLIAVRGSNADLVLKYLSPIRKSILLKYFNILRDSNVQEDGLYLSYPERLDDLDILDKLHKQLGDFAVELVK